MSELVNRILETYAAQWQDLPWEKQRHFAYRAWIATGEHAWWKRLQATRKRTEQAWRAMRETTKAERQACGLAQKRRFKRKFDVRAKSVFYTTYPEYVYWEVWFTHLRYLVLTGKKPERRLTREEREEVTALMLSETAVVQVAEWAIERVADMRWLMRIDMRDQLRSVWQKIYTKLPDDKLGLTRTGYALTHLVIGESRYYTQAVGSDYFAREVFETWGKRLISRASVDVAAEMLVCNQLMGRIAPDEAWEARKRLEAGFDKHLGRLLRPERDSLVEAEHRNIMAVMGLTPGWLGKFKA